VADFSVSSKARRDLTDIWKYIGKDSAEHADRWLTGMYEVFALLGAAPRLGAVSDEIRPGTRRFPIKNYLIYYRITGRGIQILHVFHGRRRQRVAFDEE
jgi:toxin ParE1/3/4